MRLTRTQRTSPFLYQIVPLLDILFVVLVFFILTATFVSQPGITVEPPASSFSVEPSLHTEIISVVGGIQPRIFFRDQLVSEARLNALLENKPESATIIVKADRQVPYAQVISITNLAVERGYRVVLATAPGKSAK